VWADSIGATTGATRIDLALRAHRSLIFGKRASEVGLPEMGRQQALKVLEADGQLTKAAMLCCRVRYFTDGAILGQLNLCAVLLELGKCSAGARIVRR
jgi:putative transposase